MSWMDAHRRSEELAVVAHEHVRRGDLSSATELFAAAGRAEMDALIEAPRDKPRTLGILGVSAVALLHKGANLPEATKAAHFVLGMELPKFAVTELRSILQAIWNEEAQIDAGKSFAGSQVQVSVRGGHILSGGAPAELILGKMQIVQSSIIRVAEWLWGIPLRVHGPPSAALLSAIRPWIFQAPPGSYQFSLALERPRELDLFSEAPPPVEQITSRFLSIMREATLSPGEGLVEMVPDRGYRTTLLKLARSLAPTGKSIEQIIMSEVGSSPVVFSTQSRQAIRDALRGEVPEPEGDEPPKEFRGALRALDLNRDWLEVQTSEGSVRIVGLTETVDDVIGPMVNHQVAVRAKVVRGKLSFLDIEQEE